MVKHAVLSSSTHAHTISARSGLMRSTVSVVVHTVSHSTTWRCGPVVLAWRWDRGLDAWGSTLVPAMMSTAMHSSIMTRRSSGSIRPASRGSAFGTASGPSVC